MHKLRVTALDQGMEIRQKIARPDPITMAGFDGRLDGANIVSEVGCAGGGDSGQNNAFAHD